MQPSVSATLIVRDEEKFLEGCLASIVNEVDEVVVVDTGSVDNSRDIARSYGVKLLERPWRHDFAWARNEGLNAARGDWVLYIDADERLSVPEGTRLADGLEDEEMFASRLLFRPYVSATPYREYRLFRNDPRLRFRGSMHETILPDLQRLQDEGVGRSTESAAELLHLGYEGDPILKHRRNLPLLRVAIVEHPDRLYYWYHLAETLAGLGQTDEALAVGAEGLRRAREKQVSESVTAGQIAITHARLLHEAGKDALPVIEEGLGYYARNPSLQVVKAKVLLDQGHTEAALTMLLDLAAMDFSTYCDPRLAHDRRLFDVHVPDYLGMALLRLGRRAEAAHQFARAAAAAPDDPSYRVKALAIGGGAMLGSQRGAA